MTPNQTAPIPTANQLDAFTLGESRSLAIVSNDALVVFYPFLVVSTTPTCARSTAYFLLPGESHVTARLVGLEALVGGRARQSCRIPVINAFKYALPFS